MLFIRELFRQDAALFQKTAEDVNAATDFEDVVAMIFDSFPEWDPNSDTVYRFMMAVRRKIQDTTYAG